MTTKLNIALTAATFVTALATYGQLAQGTIINIDYGTGNGTASTTGPAGGGTSWNANNGGFVAAGVNSAVDSNGNGIDVGSFVAVTSDGSGGAFSWPSGGAGDALQQDYAYLTGDSINVDLNGTTVDAYRRFTVFSNPGDTNIITIGSQWNITLIGGGNGDGQGFNVMVNDGGTFSTGTVLGLNAGTANIGTFNADNTITFSGIEAVAGGGGGADIEFWIYSTGGATAALQGVQLTLVPEPSTYALLAGFAALALVAVRRRK